MIDKAPDFVEFDLDHTGCVILALLGEVAGEGRYLLRAGSGAEYGHIKLLLSPFAGDHAYQFEWQLIEHTLPQFAKAPVLEGVKITLQEDLPGNRRVSGIRFVVVDGSYHDTDSTPQAFRLAAQLAVRDAFSRAKLGKT